MSTLFSRIVRRELPADIVYQDELVTAFRDIRPQAPVHLLVVPNEPLATANAIGPEQEALAGRLLRVASELARREGIDASGYRLIINCNADGGQEVFHLHLHLVGGRPLGPMLAPRRD